MLRDAPVQSAISFEQFLEREIHAQERHEFVDGNVFVMPGGTDRHNEIAQNILEFLRPAARTVGCRTFIESVLIRTPDETGYYPDVFVVCDSSQDSPRVKRQPCIIIEVLSEPAHGHGASESTAAIDRGEKLRNYRTIPALELYVLLEQDAPLAEVFERQADGTWRHDLLGATSSLHFSRLNLDVPLQDLYQNLPEA
jgi:Uma2 family endonuclease